MEVFGRGGVIETQTAFCILSTNALNECFYVFIWLWFHMLVMLSAINIVCLFFVAWIPAVRIWVAKQGLDSASSVYIQCGAAGCVKAFVNAFLRISLALLWQHIASKVLAQKPVVLTDKC